MDGLPRPARPAPTPERALAAALCVMLLPVVLHATPRETRARAVWLAGSRVYLASRDSGEFRRGDRLTFVDRRKITATAEVAQILDEALCVARLTTGSLERVKKLDRLTILIEPAVLPTPPVLRIGFPSPRRPNLVFACSAMSPSAALLGRGYRTEANPHGLWRFVRDTRPETSAGWPDTLEIRGYDEAIDEEIALQRGELDIAVFWPGELSQRVRDDPRWRGGTAGIRSRGVIAAAWDGADSASATTSPRDGPDLAGLDRELFRGDLVPWTRVGSPEPAAPAPAPPNGARYVADSSVPGKRAIDRFLERRARSGGQAAEVRIVFVDAEVRDVAANANALRAGVAGGRASGGTRDSISGQVEDDGPAPDSLDAAHLERRAAIEARDSLRLAPLFAIGCPVVCRTELSDLVAALGADALADLLDCSPAGNGP